MPNPDRLIAFADFERYIIEENDTPVQDQPEIVADIKKAHELVGKDWATEDEWILAISKVWKR
jgi:hypothetical protein